MDSLWTSIIAYIMRLSRHGRELWPYPNEARLAPGFVESLLGSNHGTWLSSYKFAIRACVNQSNQRISVYLS